MKFLAKLSKQYGWSKPVGERKVRYMVLAKRISVEAKTNVMDICADKLTMTNNSDETLYITVERKFKPKAKP